MTRRRLPPEALNACFISTPWGWAWLLATRRGLWACNWPLGSREEAVADLELIFQQAFKVNQVLAPLCELKLEKSYLLKQAEEALLAFFCGSPEQLQAVPADAGHFTPWQKQVYDVVRSIPAGETRSYRQVAKECGNIRAARAVGQALATNPLPLFIPCHRVIHEDGRLGHYGCGGTELKERLLALEQKRGR
ncbi:MAG: MGMT family protein [Bacillota bacterium]|nr:MGMT family protein [Bacillota bacterium]